MTQARGTPIVYQGQQPAAAPFPKVVYGGMVSAFGNNIYGIRRVSYVAQAGTTDQVIISPNGTCSNGLATPQSFVLAFGTQQAVDSYGLNILGGPAEPEPGNIFTQAVGTSSTRVVLGFKTTKGKGGRKLPWQTRTYAGLGIKGGNGPTGVGLPPAYGTFPIPDPANPGSYISPFGTADKIVNAPEIEVEIATVGGIPQGLQFGGDSTNGLAAFIDNTSVQFDSLGRLHVASLPGAAGAALGLYKSGFGIQINGTLPPSGVTAAAIAGSGLGIGLYDYVATKRTIGGKESGPCPPVSMTTTTGNQEGSIVLPALDATNDPLAIGYSLYRSPVGGAGTPIAQCGGVTASVDGSGKTVYTWTGSGCTITYDPFILAQPGSAGPPATPPLPIDPAGGTVTVFVPGTCSFTSGGVAFDQTLPQTYPAGQGYHWVTDIGAGTYLDTASDASISANKRPPTDNTPQIDTLLATVDDTQNSPPFSALEHIAPHGAIPPLRRGNKVRTDNISIDINLPNNWLEAIGLVAKGQPCVSGNGCPVPSGGVPTGGGPYGPGSTLNGNDPGHQGTVPPGAISGTPQPGLQCLNPVAAAFQTAWTNVHSFHHDGSVNTQLLATLSTGSTSVTLTQNEATDNDWVWEAALGVDQTKDRWFQCAITVDETNANQTDTYFGYGDSSWAASSPNGLFWGFNYHAATSTWHLWAGTQVVVCPVQPGLSAELGIYSDCNLKLHLFMGYPGGDLTDVTGLSNFAADTGIGRGALLCGASGTQAASGTHTWAMFSGIRWADGLPGDITIANYGNSGSTYQGTTPPCPSAIDPAYCTQWTQGYNDFLANTAATAPPTCPYGPNPFSLQCKNYDLGWWDGYNTFHASAPNTGQGSNSPSNTTLSPTPTTPGTVPTGDSTYWQAGYAAHQAGGSNTCPYTDATQCLYWTQGWQAATGSGTSSTTTNAPVPASVPTGNDVDYQAGYNAFINGLPITCPGGDTATQCQYYQQGWTDAASVTSTSGSTTGSPGTGGTVQQGGGTIGGGGGTTGGTTALTPPAGDQCTGTAGAYPGALGAMSGYQVGGMLCYESGTGFYWFNDGTGQSGIFQYVSGTWSQVGGGAFAVYSPNGLPFGSKYSGIVGGAGSTGSGSTGTVSGAGGGSSSGIIQSGDVVVQGNESITGNLEVQSNATVLGTLLAKSGLVAQGPISSTGAVSGLYFQGGKVALTYAATISLNPALGDLFTTTTTTGVGNATINAASAGLAGQRIYVQITNDATAGRTITFGTNFSSTGTLIGTVSKTAVVLFESDGVSWFEVGRSTGGTSYTLPAATTSVLGGVIVGAGLTVSTGTISFANPMNAQDDLIVGGASGALTKLAKGADGFVLTIDPTTHHAAWTASTGTGGAVPTATTAILGTTLVDNNGGGSPVAITKAGLLVAPPNAAAAALLQTGDGGFAGGGSNFNGVAGGTVWGVNMAASSAYKAAVLSDSPAAYYRLSDSTTLSVTAADSSGNARNATYRNDVYSVAAGATTDGDSAVGSAYRSAASRTGGAGIPTGANPWSVECWLRTTATAAQCLWSFGTATEPQLAALIVTGPTTMNVWSATTNVTFTTGTFNDGNWHQVVVTYDGTNVRLYFDGAVVGSPQAKTYNITFPGFGLEIGNYTSPTGGYPFYGEIDEFSLYAGTLSATRISAHYGGGASYSTIVLADTPAIYYRLNEAVGAADSSGNSRSAGFGTSTTLGASGATADSDGAISCSGGLALDRILATWMPSGGADRSFECWFKTTATTGCLAQIGSDGTGSGGLSWNILLTSATSIQCNSWAGTGPTITTKTLNDGSWHHLVVTYSGGLDKVYVDGVLQGSGSLTLNTPASGTFRAGNLADGSFSFVGTLDEWALYPTTLSAARVLAHAAAGSQANTSASDYFRFQAAGLDKLRGDGSGNLWQAGHLNHIANAPANPPAGAGLGTSPPAPTVATGSTDDAGQLQFGTGSATPANGKVATITFLTPFFKTPFLTFTPGNSATAALSGSFYPANVSFTSFDLMFSGTLTASQAAATYAVNWSAAG